MRRTAAAAGIALLIAASVPAMDLSWGIKSGLNLSRFWGDDAENAGLDRMQAGFTAGAYLSLNLLDEFSICPGLSYAMKGARGELVIDVIGIHSETDYSYRLHYLELPVTARFLPPVPVSFQPFVEAGIAPSLFLDGRAEVTTNGSSTTHDTDDDYESFDIGLPMGGGVLFSAGDVDLFFEVMFTPGITEISENGSELKNSVISILAGVQF
jgi:hypothetical protein